MSGPPSLPPCCAATAKVSEEYCKDSEVCRTVLLKYSKCDAVAGSSDRFLAHADAASVLDAALTSAEAQAGKISSGLGKFELGKQFFV